MAQGSRAIKESEKNANEEIKKRREAMLSGGTFSKLSIVESDNWVKNREHEDEEVKEQEIANVGSLIH